MSNSVSHLQLPIVFENPSSPIMDSVTGNYREIRSKLLDTHSDLCKFIFKSRCRLDNSFPYLVSLQREPHIELVKEVGLDFHFQNMEQVKKVHQQLQEQVKNILQTQVKVNIIADNLDFMGQALVLKVPELGPQHHITIYYSKKWLGSELEQIKKMLL